MNFTPTDIVALLGLAATVLFAFFKRPVDKADANLKVQQANDIVIDNLRDEVSRLSTRVDTLEKEKTDCAKRIEQLEARLVEKRARR